VTYTANVSVNGAIIANGGAGTSGQVLTSSAGGNVYWSTVSGGGSFSNGQSISVANLAITGSLTANGSVGTSGQALVSTGTGVQWGTVSPGYNYSTRFDGSSQYLTTPQNAAFAFGTGDFTIEAWIYTTSSATQRIISINNTTEFLLINTGSNVYLDFYDGTADSSTGSNYVPQNQWVHVAVARSGTSLKFFINGVLSGSTTNSINLLSASVVYIGRFSGSAINYFSGFISNLRVVKGTAVYTTAFTPPTSPLSAISGTSLLTCNSITPTSDSSTNNLVITNNGTATTTATLSPFTSTTVSIPTTTLTSVNQSFTGDGTTTTFSVAGGYTPNAISVYYNGLRLRNGSDVTVTNGSTIVFAVAPLSGVLIDVVGTVPTTYSSITPQVYSVGFNGSGQSLSLPTNAAFAFGTGDFTIEFWAFSTDITGSSLRGIIDTRANSTSASGLLLRENSAGFLVVTNNTTLFTTAGKTPNVWQHIAIVKISGTIVLYVNGVNVGSAASATSLTDNYFRISGFTDTQASPYGYLGYLSNVRVVKGIGVYTGAFTPPQTPLAAVQSAVAPSIQAITGTQTSLLTCNAPTIIDGSTNALTITNNGSAPVSTAVVPTFTNVTINNTSGSGGLSLASVQTANLTATAGYIYPINTSSGPVYVTLPASPSAGQQIAITDYAGTFAGNNCIINPNGSKITGVSANAVLAVSREGASIVYVDSAQGWLGYGNFISNPVGPYSISYLIVAGGGGGGNAVAATDNGGGGGGGGLISGTSVLSPSTTYTITVGGGGPVQTAGINSSISNISTAFGGGYGGFASAASSGGSGGGGGGFSNSAAGTGTSGQGNNGGAGTGSSSPAYGSGGGGGSSASGVAGSSSSAGAGGAGTSSSITGSSVTYAGGGGGGSSTTGTGGAGGAGGGGAGGGSAVGVAGTTNTGGGGGGGGNASNAGAAGGSGVVILSIPTGNYTGTKTGSPTVTTSGNFTILTFTASGSYTA
jgi:hypothetical protein